jgi:hypothetical protein
MQRSSSLGLVAALAFSTVASAAPTKHEAWAAGRLARVDTTAKSVVVTQGSHEMTFVLEDNAQLVHGKQSLDVNTLAGDVGHPVRVRYTLSKGTRVADRIQVSESRATQASTTLKK